MSCRIVIENLNLDDDTPMWKMELLRASHDYAERICPGDRLGRMGGDTSPLREIEKVQQAYYDGAINVMESKKSTPDCFHIWTVTDQNDLNRPRECWRCGAVEKTKTP